MFPEWQLTIASRSDNLGLSATEIRMAVHEGQDTQFHRLIAPEESLQVCGRVVTVKPSRWTLAGQEIIKRYCAGDAIEIESGVNGQNVSFVVKNAQGEQAISAGSAQISG